jgi:type I restriction-modification system restriction subunit
MTQCELWTDNTDLEGNMESDNKINYSLNQSTSLMEAEDAIQYGNKR